MTLRNCRVACWASMLLVLVACAGRSLPVDPKLPRLPKSAIGPNYESLDWAAGIGTAVAVAFILLSVWFPTPKFRLMAGAGVGIAVGAWLLKFLLVEYLWIACLIAFALALAGMALYIFGHRKWVEKFVKVDINKDGVIG